MASTTPVLRAHAEKQRYFAEARFQVDHDGGPLAEARDVHRGVDGNRRRARSALGAQKDQALPLRRGLRAVAAGHCPSQRRLKHIVGRRPRQELVRTSAHCLQDEFGVGGGRDREDAGRRRVKPHTLNHRHCRWGVAARVHHDEVQWRPVAYGTVIEEADGNAPERNTLPRWLVNPMSWLTMNPTSCAMFTAPPRNARGGTETPRGDTSRIATGMPRYSTQDRQESTLQRVKCGRAHASFVGR